MKKHLIAVICLFLAITSSLVAQTATGVIRGTVQDRTGAVLIDAHVRLVDEARNQIWEQITKSPSLRPPILSPARDDRVGSLSCELRVQSALSPCPFHHEAAPNENLGS